MTVAELIALLEDFGGHLTVKVAAVDSETGYEDIVSVDTATHHGELIVEIASA